MIAGHRRKMASEIAQMETMPCLVRELTDDEAIIIMVDSNLQREILLLSEKAFAYRMKLEAMKRQGQRTDLTSVPVGQRLGITSRELLASNSPDSNTQIQRYIRLTHLIPSLLDMVDEGRIAMRPAVELSYLPEKEQEALFEIMGLEECTPSHVQAIKLRKFYEEGKLSSDVILSIMQEEKPNQKEQFRMPRERISKYFSPGTPRKPLRIPLSRRWSFTANASAVWSGETFQPRGQCTLLRAGGRGFSLSPSPHLTPFNTCCTNRKRDFYYRLR